MKGRSLDPLNAKGLVKVIDHFGAELGSSITRDGIWDACEEYYFVHQKFESRGSLFRSSYATEKVLGNAQVAPHI